MSRPTRKQLIVFAIVCAAAAAPGRAAGAQQRPWELTASVGANVRSERGNLLKGARFEGGVRRPVGAGSVMLEFGGGLTQITARHGARGDGPNVKENALEGFVRVERALAARGRWRLHASAAPVVALSLGCTAGGSFVRDQAGHGETECTNDFAAKSNVRLGGAARLTSEFRASRAAVIVGGDAAVGTVAAGRSVAWALTAGFRAALR